MYVQIVVNTTSGCHISSNVYSSTGNCASLSQISCLSGAPLDDVHSLTGLTVGSTYYVQVCYSPGGPCGNNGSAQYCIAVGVPDPPCNLCSSPCGTASGYATSPSVQQVVDNCNTSPLSPALQPNSNNTFCYSFVATNTTVNFNVVITSNCSGGNVTNFNWSLYNSPSCGSAIQTGTLSSLVFSNLTVGNNYVFCYTFTVPGTCTHSQHCPYFVGATILPITWLPLEGRAIDKGKVQLDWGSASEYNNDHFEVERSCDVDEFNVIGNIPGAGDAIHTNWYRFIDEEACNGLNFYRITQVDRDGTSDRSNTVAVMVSPIIDVLQFYPNPTGNDASILLQVPAPGLINIEIHGALGELVYCDQRDAEAGRNEIQLDLRDLAEGVYLLTVSGESWSEHSRFLKQ
jgi:hypothetical protein